MTYTADADSVVAPTLATLAGTAQADFLALKQKLNNFFLASQFDAVLMNQGLKSGTSYVNSLPAGTSPGIMYGHAVNITRNDLGALGGTGVSAVAAQLTAIQGNNCNDPGVYIFGVATEAWTSPVNSQAILIGAETSVISQYNANTAAIVGLDVVFKNRPDALVGAGLSVVQGLGINQYNTRSRAIQITAQASSSAGERMGWNRGITFEANAVGDAWDPDFGGAGIGGLRRGILINMADMGNPATTEPWTAYGGKQVSALALSEYMSITWDKLQFTRSWLDSTNTTMWLFGNGNYPTTVPRMGYDYGANNCITLPNYKAPGAGGAATGSIQMIVNGTPRNMLFN